MLENREGLSKDEIAIIAVGRAGCTILSKLPSNSQNNATFYYIHTQSNYLKIKKYSNFISIETDETRDFGTNGEAYIGEICAKEHKNNILSKLSKFKLVFVIAGLGGGTGSGATPYILKLLKERNILCLSVISLPFAFEGERKNRIALSTYAKIKKNCDSVIVIDNDKILENYSDVIKNIFKPADKFMSSVIYGFTGILTRPGLINVAIDDIELAIKGMGVSTVGIGIVSGASDAKRAIIATKKAIKNSQIFRPFNSGEVKSVVVSITSGLDMGIHEFEEVGATIRDIASENAIVVVGTVIDPEMQNEIEVIIISSGFTDNLEILSNENLPYTETFRSISFEPEYLQAGVSILSYFGDILKQKYSNIQAKVRIVRKNNTVTLIVESEIGIIEEIEKTLDVYGDVVIGTSPISALLDNQVDIEKLEMKLEMSAMEIRHNEKIISLYKDRVTGSDVRVKNLEDDIKKLHYMLGNTLKGNNEVALSAINLAHSTNSLVKTSMSEINQIIGRKFIHTGDEQKVRDAIDTINKEEPNALNKVREIFTNSMYGVTGNSLYDFLISLINNIPK